MIIIPKHQEVCDNIKEIIQVILKHNLMEIQSADGNTKGIKIAVPLKYLKVIFVELLKCY